MKNSEKILIENLFYRLNNIEKTVSDRDQEAENIINNLLQKNKNAAYYMVQTILIQETAIQELNNKIKLLDKTVIQNNKNDFLSKGLKKTILNTNQFDNQNTTNNPHASVDYINQSKPIPNDVKQYHNNRSTLGGGVSSFLGNALQTAVGVAGGVVAGNMLTNLLHPSKQEDNALDISHEDIHSNISDEHINNSLYDNVIDQDVLHHDNIDENDLEYVDYEDTDLDNINYD